MTCLTIYNCTTELALHLIKQSGEITSFLFNKTVRRNHILNFLKTLIFKSIRTSHEKNCSMFSNATISFSFFENKWCENTSETNEQCIAKIKVSRFKVNSDWLLHDRFSRKSQRLKHQLLYMMINSNYFEFIMCDSKLEILESLDKPWMSRKSWIHWNLESWNSANVCEGQYFESPEASRGFDK